MKRIGITGPTGSGKTTVLRALEQLGVRILDADAIYYDLLAHSEEMKKQLLERFGRGILEEDGSIGRKRLGAIVFRDPEALLELNAITHPFVRREVDRAARQAEAQGAVGVAVDAIALVESGIADDCDIVAAVLAPAEVRIRRIMARDGIDEDYARARVTAQKPDGFYESHSHILFRNDGDQDPEAFAQRVLQEFRSIL